MAKAFNSKLALNDHCEHGYLKPHCTQCFPADQAQEHHGKVFDLIQKLVPTAQDFALIGRREHAPIIQGIINELAQDHQTQFPGCRNCGLLQGSEYAPETPDVDDLSNDIRSQYTTLGDEPTLEVDVVPPTQEVPVVKKRRFSFN
jgi:hypothetical protein